MPRCVEQLAIGVTLTVTVSTDFYRLWHIWMVRIHMPYSAAVIIQEQL